MLQGITVTEENRNDIIRAGQDIENERLHVLSEQALAMGKANDGVKAFFPRNAGRWKGRIRTILSAKTWLRGHRDQLRQD